jgi:hypothetical protein
VILFSAADSTVRLMMFAVIAQCLFSAADSTVRLMMFAVIAQCLKILCLVSSFGYIARLQTVMGKLTGAACCMYCGVRGREGVISGREMCVTVCIVCDVHWGEAREFSCKMCTAVRHVT